MKKPARKQLTQILSEKYGINLQYLKESYSFKSLLNTQVVLFEAISRITPKNSVLRQVLSEISTSLKTKNGVQSLDLNNIIQQIFQHAGFSNEDVPLMESFSFNEIEKAFQKAEVLVEKKESKDQEEVPSEDKKDDGKETEDSGDSKEEEKEDKEETEESPKDVQKEEVAQEEEPPKKLSDEELMKAIKDLTNVMNGPEAVEDEEEL